MRLACQIRPTKSLEVTPLLPPTATPREAFARPDHTHGSDQVIAVLFADLRSFTQFSEKRLPYDVVFVLNRYFQAMGMAIADAVASWQTTAASPPLATRHTQEGTT